MRAWDFVFETEAGFTFDPASPESDAAAAPPGPPSGWTGTAGPLIDPLTWPRSPRSGLPMAHQFTIRLPEEYRRRGPELVGLSFFIGDYEFSEEPSGDPNDPHLQGISAARLHPEARILEDIIGGAFAAIWLTEAELQPGPPPADVREPGTHEIEDAPDPWLTNPQRGIWLVEREDVNAGKVPVEYVVGPDGYQPAGEELWFNARTHLGGTTMHIQGLPEGLTPYYLELEEFFQANFGGGGNAQFDLESDVFDWACG